MKLAIPTLSVSRAAGGLFFSVRRLAQELSRSAGVRCGVFAPRDRLAREDLSQWLPIQPHLYAVRGPASLGYSRTLRRQLDRFRPHAIHSHGLWMYYSAASSRWARRAGAPHIVSPRGMLDPWALAHKPWKKRLAGWLYQNRSLRKAACIHALNQAEYESIRRFGLRNPVCIVPNGVDIPPDKAGWQAAGQPAACAGLDGRKTLLYLGRLHPKKGLPALLSAWAATDHRFRQDWVLVIAGWDQDGHGRQLAGIVSHLQISDSVQFVGPQYDDAKDACFRQASGFVLPSLSEGLPMVVLEAWSYTLPVLMTAQCHLPDGFNARAAVRIEPEADRMREGLEQFLRLSDRERREMGQNGRALVQRRYSWPKVAAQIHSVYQWALGGGAPPSCVVTE